MYIGLFSQGLLLRRSILCSMYFIIMLMASVNIMAYWRGERTKVMIGKVVRVLTSSPNTMFEDSPLMAILTIALLTKKKSIDPNVSNSTIIIVTYTIYSSTLHHTYCPNVELPSQHWTLFHLTRQIT